MATVTPTPKATRYPIADRSPPDHGHWDQGDDRAGSGQTVRQTDEGDAATVMVMVSVRASMVVIGRSVGRSVSRSDRPTVRLSDRREYADGGGHTGCSWMHV